MEFIQLFGSPTSMVLVAIAGGVLGYLLKDKIAGFMVGNVWLLYVMTGLSLVGALVIIMPQNLYPVTQ